MKKIFLGLFALLLFHSYLHAQLLVDKNKFTRADTLRGTLSSLRSCYDINYYHLDVKFDIEKEFISGSNLFKFTATQDFKTLQFYLHISKTEEWVFTKDFEKKIFCYIRGDQRQF